MTEQTRAWFARALASAIEAGADPACRRFLGPIVPGAALPGGARLPGLPHELDPPQAAFNLAWMLGWSERDALQGDPQGSALAAMLAAADWRARSARRLARSVPSLADLFAALAGCRAGMARADADADALALRGVVALLGGSDVDAGRARALLPQRPGSGGDPLWRDAERASTWVRAALIAMRAEADVAARWSEPPPAPWPGRLPERGPALLLRTISDASLDAMPIDLWLSYLVDR